ncbi:hypothetical protein B0H16DRAFT_1835946 [Mycena metata]|uniref:Uncharacterized protein n=1 Tax=Mycena metata TaxID=1033252 RepID=A0AAD7NB45_9AGAR|nr:hypothetical protein B0H16DRAFT_1835946 [Mycena metata]
MTVEVKERPVTTGPNTNTRAKLTPSHPPASERDERWALFRSNQAGRDCLYKDRELAAAGVETTSSYHRLIAARRLPRTPPARLFNGNGNTQTQTAPTPTHETKDERPNAREKSAGQRREAKTQACRHHDIGRKDMIVARQARRTPHRHMCSAQPVGLIAARRLPSHHPREDAQLPTKRRKPYAQLAACVEEQIHAPRPRLRTTPTPTHERCSARKPKRAREREKSGGQGRARSEDASAHERLRRVRDVEGGRSCLWPDRSPPPPLPTIPEKTSARTDAHVRWTIMPLRFPPPPPSTVPRRPQSRAGA